MILTAPGTTSQPITISVPADLNHVMHIENDFERYSISVPGTTFQPNTINSQGCYDCMLIIEKPCKKIRLKI
jgi:hypothetical protein